MSFNRFVIINTLRNKQLYLAYFFSTLFSVMVFFTFATFSYHPELVKALNSSVSQGMKAAATIIYVFSFIFVLYSMDVFLQSRKKEFGTLIINGMSPRQLKKMVFIENLVIGFSATIVGVLAGIIFAQLILWLSKFMLHFTLGFYLPVKAMVMTVIAFVLLFLFISFFIQFRLPKVRLQELLKSDELGKGALKPSKIKSALGVILILIGYVVAIKAQGVQVVLAMFPVIFLVILGTYFFFNQFTVRVVESLKRHTKIFWKKTNLVVFSDLAFRMKDNARSFFFVAVITTVAFAAIGSLYGFQNIALKTSKVIPYDFVVAGDQVKDGQAQTETVLKDNKVTFADHDFTYYVDASSNYFVKASDYNAMAKWADQEAVKVAAGQTVHVFNEYMEVDQDAAPATVALNGQNLTVAKKITTSVMPVLSDAIYIVGNDTDLSSLAEKKAVAYNADGARDDLVAAGETLMSNDKLTVTAQKYLEQSIINSFGPILFVGIFIGIVFFVSAGSFLYFRLYSDLGEDVKKFAMIYKLGLSKKELKKMIYQQVGILFFTPIAVSLLHGVVALTAMYHLLNLGLQPEAGIVLGAFLLIQVVYYLVARHFYFEKVLKQVMN